MKKKKKDSASKLSLDKETIKNLNQEQLSGDEAQQVEGGLATHDSGYTDSSCCGIFTGTSCC